MGAIATSHYAKSLWSHNPIPRGCVLYLPLWSPGLRGDVFKSIDPYRHTCTVTGASWDNQGRSFAATDVITLPITTLITLTTNFTMIVWAKRSADTANMSLLNSRTSDNCWQLNLNTGGVGKVHWNFWVSGAGTGITSSGTVTSGAFANIALTQSSTAGHVLYIDTADNGTDATTTALDSGGTVINLGGAIGGAWLTGSIGEVWIYSRALSAAEVLHNYNVTKWRYG